MDFLSDGRRRTEATEDLAIGGLGNSSAKEEICLSLLEEEDKSTHRVTLCVLTLWQSDIETQLFLKVRFHLNQLSTHPPLSNRPSGTLLSGPNLPLGAVHK